MLRVKEGLILVLQFIAFDIEQCSSPTGGDCACDYLTITDGDGTTLMEKTCGSCLPATIISKSNIVNLLFSTDSRSGSDKMTGWKMSWSAVLPGGEKSISSVAWLNQNRRVCC